MIDNYKLMRLDSWLDLAQASLKSANISSARLDSELIAAFVVNKTRVWVHSHPEYQPNLDEQTKLSDLLKRRVANKPIAYILGEKEFYGRCFFINESVLVPRPESESLVNLALSIKSKDLKFIDIGTGSGVLGITVILERPNWKAHLTDVSNDALVVTKTNLVHYKVEKLAKVRNQHLLNNDENEYGLAIANLPYVPDNFCNNPDLRAEPTIALFSGSDGLDLYREFFAQIKSLKLKPFNIITESLLSQHKELEKLASQSGYTLLSTKGLGQHFVLV